MASLGLSLLWCLVCITGLTTVAEPDVPIPVESALTSTSSSTNSKVASVVTLPPLPEPVPSQAGFNPVSFFSNIEDVHELHEDYDEQLPATAKPNITQLECLQQNARLYFSPPDGCHSPNYTIFKQRQASVDSSVDSLDYNYYDATPPMAKWETVFDKPFDHSEAVFILLPNTAYRFKVQATCLTKDGKKRWNVTSDEVQCHTRMDRPSRNPEPVMAYYDQDSRKMLIRWLPLQEWEKAADGFTYIVSVRPVNGRRNETIEKPTTEEQFEVAAKPDDRYWVSVKSHNSLGYSYQPAVEYMGNLPQTKPNQTVQQFRVVAVHGTQVTFSWQPVPYQSVNGIFSGYRIVFKSSKHNSTYGDIAHLVPGNYSTISLDNLFEPSTKYEATIKVLNSDDQTSEPTGPISFETQSFIRPRRPSITNEFYCKKEEGKGESELERYLKLTFYPNNDHNDRTIDQLKYDFMVCIKELTNPTPLVQYCLNRNLTIPSAPEKYKIGQNNTVQHKLLANELNVEILVLSVAYNGNSASTQSLPSRIVKRKEDWAIICQTNTEIVTTSTTTTTTTTTSTTTTTTSTTTETPRTRSLGHAPAVNADAEGSALDESMIVRPGNPMVGDEQEVESGQHTIWPIAIVGIVVGLLLVIAVAVVAFHYRRQLLSRPRSTFCPAMGQPNGAKSHNTAMNEYTTITQKRAIPEEDDEDEDESDNDENVIYESPNQTTPQQQQQPKATANGGRNDDDDTSPYRSTTLQHNP